MFLERFYTEESYKRFLDKLESLCISYATYADTFYDEDICYDCMVIEYDYVKKLY